MIKRFGLKLALLLGIVVLNIYPMGCFSWGGGTISTQPTLASYYVIKKDNYIKALECAENNPSTNAKDKEYLAIKKQQIKNEVNDPFSELYTEIDNFRAKYPTCNFN